MKSSRRIKRMDKTRKRSKFVTKMNLTSLMDVFTILVFFLLVNSGAADPLESPKDVKLPESRAECKPKETVVIYISPETGPNTQQVAGSQEVTIMADKSIPFSVVKRIMSTCTSEGYGNISLAVVQKDAQVAAI